ncbi:hypothetical protein RJT34_12786 [Clitoria ternatea]|uniref:Cellulose synthase n=1 Tax=Clitoria ternatea TaxID=43366 RepID=A0AAN9PL93_CLITE
MGNGLRLLCFVLTYGLVFTGSYATPSDGTLSSDNPSATDSLKADPGIEPPIMVINTVLSVMAYDYPTEKLSVYFSDDAASDITFYALLEASSFAKHWLPFCKRFKVQPTSPAAFFNNISSSNNSKELVAIKKDGEGFGGEDANP